MVDTLIIPKSQVTPKAEKEKVLIIGYGRAGKRHAKIAKELGLDVCIYDPYIGKMDDWIDSDKVQISWNKDLALFANSNYAVIATPPDTHLNYIIDCNLAGLKILCEKPLCGLDQIQKIGQGNFLTGLMVAYNWRYHPIIIQLQKDHRPGNKYKFEFGKTRIDIPEWGLLLDHISHDLDIALFLTGQKLTVDYAHYFESQYLKSYKINLSNNTVSIVDTVYSYTTPRSDLIIRYIDDFHSEVFYLNPTDDMFYAMWQQFLSGNYKPNLMEAIKTQELVEEVNRYVQSDTHRR